MQPERGDAVEAWIKFKRDEWAGLSGPHWNALNDLLDEYRDHADFNVELGNELPDEAYK